jgi:hypothetical protein
LDVPSGGNGTKLVIYFPVNFFLNEVEMIDKILEALRQKYSHLFSNAHAPFTGKYGKFLKEKCSEIHDLFGIQEITLLINEYVTNKSVQSEYQEICHKAKKFN